MTVCDDPEMSAQQRAALIVWLLARGHSFTTLEIAQIAKMKRNGAREMMNRLAGQVPIVCDHGRWKLLTD